MATKVEILVGSVWRDKDKRMGGRRVRVTHIFDVADQIAYVSAVDGRIKYTSRRERFLKAFTREA